MLYLTSIKLTKQQQKRLWKGWEGFYVSFLAIYSRKTYNYAWHIDAYNELGNWVITALDSDMLENILMYLCWFILNRPQYNMTWKLFPCDNVFISRRCTCSGTLGGGSPQCLSGWNQLTSTLWFWMAPVGLWSCCIPLLWLWRPATFH